MPRPTTNFSPLNALLIAVAGIVVAEVVAMILVYLLPDLPYFYITLLDAAVMVLLVFPLLYVVSFRPLLEEMRARQRASDALVDANDHLRELEQIIEQSPAVAFRLRLVPGWPVEFVSPNVRQFGYTAADLLKGKVSHAGIVHPEDLARVTDEVRDHIAQGAQQFTQQHRIYTAGGELRWLEVRASLRRDPAGEATHYEGILLDITPQKAAEAEISRANRELQALTEAEQAQRSRAEALVEATGALNSSLDLAEVLDAILSQVRRVVDYRAALILLSGTDGVTVAPRLPGDASAVPTSECLLQIFPELAETVAGHESRLVARRDTPVDLPGFEWTRSYLIAPLTARDRFVGRLLLLSDRPDYFAAGDLTLLTGFTAQAGLAVHNARLFAQEQQARQTAEVLRTASVAFARSLDVDVVSARSLDYAARLVPFDRAAFVLRAGESELAVYASRHNGAAAEHSVAHSRIQADDFPQLATLLAGQGSFAVPDTQAYPDWTSFMGGAPARSWLGVPLVAGGRVLGLYSFEAAEPGIFQDEHIRPVEILAGQAAVAIQNAWLFEQVREGSERLQALSRRLVEIQENERHYIARELHDEAGQTLTALVVALKMLDLQAGDPERVRALAADMDRQVQAFVENLHRLARALRPAALDHLGLQAAVNQHIESVMENHGLHVNFAVAGLPSRLSPNLETMLYRVIQEGLTNIVRHAGATRADILLQRRDGRLVLVIEDDGVGFDPGQDGAGEPLGVLGMRERAEMLGGELIIESAPGAGTTLVVEVPYDLSDSIG